MRLSETLPYEHYTPEAVRPDRSGLALCLSGGGFRAALFHLGALRRLNELGVLGHLDLVSAVSGGSIVAAYLGVSMRPWPLPGERFETFEDRVAKPLREFMGRNQRRHLLQRPWNLFIGDRAIRRMARNYRRLFGPARLGDLPERPDIVLNATDITYGVAWPQRKKEVGSYQAGYAGDPDLDLSLAVGASACFPPVFNPLNVSSRLGARLTGGKYQPMAERKRLNAGLALSDGGVYDNLGLEPVWKSSATVLVSDGGAPLPTFTDRLYFKRIPRYAAILGNQVGALRKRWLIDRFVRKDLEGTYWGIGSAAARYGPEVEGAYSEDLASNVLASIRTDLDAFSDAEASVLENHGYLLADTAIHTHVPTLLPENAPPAVLPHPEWADEERVREALKRSHIRTLLGRNR